MTIDDMIRELQHAKQHMAQGGTAEFALYNRETREVFRVDPDADRFDFELTRGDGEAVLEFS